MKDDILFAYYVIKGCCFPLMYEQQDHGWSFCVYSCGTVKLKAWVSSYSFTVPDTIINKITEYLVPKKREIEAIKKCLESRRPSILTSTARGAESFAVFLGEVISDFFIERRTDESILAEIAEHANGAQAVDPQEAAHSKELDLIAAQNRLIDIFEEVCKLLRSYGLSLMFSRETWKNCQSESFECQWNIPNHFYSFDESSPILEYIGDQSFALYGHGLLQIEGDDCFYQLKIPQSAVDKITDYYSKHPDMIYSMHLAQWYKQSRTTSDSKVIVIGNYDNDSAISLLDNPDEQIAIANTIFADIHQYLRPYGLETEMADGRFICRWPLPDNSHSDNILFENKDKYGSKITIYDCGAIHIINDFYLGNSNFYYMLGDKACALKTAVRLPKTIVNKLRQAISQNKEKIAALAASPFNLLNSDGTDNVLNRIISFNSIGTSLSYLCDIDGADREIMLPLYLKQITGKEFDSPDDCGDINKEISVLQYIQEYTGLLNNIFEMLEPYGISWHTQSVRSLSNLLFFPDNNSASDADREQ